MKEMFFVRLGIFFTSCLILEAESTEPTLRGNDFATPHVNLGTRGRELQLNPSCDVDEIYKNTTSGYQCVKGKEYGESCEQDSDCFTGVCSSSDQVCDCLSKEDCMGCISTDAVCVWVELSHEEHIHSLKVDNLVAYDRNNGGITVFSKSLLSLSEREPEYMRNSTNVAPLTSIHANVNVTSIDDISLIKVEGEISELLDAQMFVGQTWVKSIDQTDISSVENDGVSGVLAIDVWPRVSTKTDPIDLVKSNNTISKMWVIDVEKVLKFDFDIPVDMGFEFAGKGANSSIIYIDSDVKVAGRLSLKNAKVMFVKGSMNITNGASVIFQSCEIVEIELHCPIGFIKLGDKCFYSTSVRFPSASADEVCASEFADAFVAEKNDILSNFAEVGYEQELESLLQQGQSSWIASSENPMSCTSIDSNGVIKEYAEITGFCNDLKHILCVVKSKELIVGRYTNYFSTVFVGSYQGLADRLRSVQMPNSIESKITLVDIFDMNYGKEKVAFTVPDGRPKKVRIGVNLKDGKESDIQVALDTTNKPSTESPHKWEVKHGSWLPSKVQVHATGNVCVKSIDIFLESDTGAESKAFSLSAKMFSDCLDSNVCSERNEDQCGRSLMYYDETQECAVLASQDPRYPRDLSFELYKGHCNRLTSWNHDTLGEKFVLELFENTQVSQVPQDAIIFEEETIEVHHYVFDPNKESSTILNQCNLLPSQFKISGGSYGSLKGFRIARYNQTVASIDFGSLLDCKYLCSEFAHEDRGVKLGRGNGASTLYIDLSESSCKKLLYVETQNITGRGDVDGLTACMSPITLEVNSIADLQKNINSLAMKTSAYRSLHVKIPSDGLHESGSIKIPENRVLSIGSSDDNNDAGISSIQFEIPSLSELHFENVVLSGSARIVVSSHGLLDISGGSVEQIANISTPFLKNLGTARLGGVHVSRFALLENMQDGEADLMYVTFTGESRLINWGDRDSVSVSNIDIHEEFDLSNMKSLDIGLIYNEISADDALCKGNDKPSMILNLDAQSCTKRCNDEFLCSGFIVYQDDEAGTQCGLCLGEKECAFNCSETSSLYWKGESNFKFTKMRTCHAGSRPILSSMNFTTLEKCKASCSYYNKCEGFILESRNSCQLVADLDVSHDCIDENEKQDIYIAYDSNSLSFVQVAGELTETSGDVLARFPKKKVDECSTICIMTLHCASFRLDDGDCVLFNTNEHKRSNTNTGLYISVNEHFPKKRYMEYTDQVPLTSPMRMHTTKTIDRCKRLCDEEFFCMAISFWPYASPDELNCHLFDYSIQVDKKGTTEVLDANFVKKYETGTTMLFAYMFDTFAPSTSGVFVEEIKVPEILFEECKSLCLHDEDCTAIRYTSEICYIGSLDDGKYASNSSVIQSGQHFVLQAKPFYSDVIYERSSACYTGELLQNATLVPELSWGYTRLEKTCTSVSVGNLTSKMGPVGCASECKRNPKCSGFAHYVDYGGTKNNEKIGVCRLLTQSSSQIDLGSCDAVDHNMDIYLRGDIGMTCEAACTLNKQCTSFSFDEMKGCLLYSEIALLRDEKGSCSTEADFEYTKYVSINKKYREKGDALVAVPHHCFKEVEDDADLGCFGQFSNESASFIFEDNTSLTRHSCQKKCKELQNKYYLIHGGVSCYCSDSEEVYKDLVVSSTCTVQCPGNNEQTCGGLDSVFVGATNAPEFNVTLSHCRQKCSELPSCKGIFFSSDGQGTKCEMKSTVLIDKCTTSDPSRLSFIQSFERYYRNSEYEVEVKDVDVLHSSKEHSIYDCKRLCDSFSRCYGIRFEEDSVDYNCDVLGGGKVNYASSNTNPDIYIVHDAASFTKFAGNPKNEEAIATFENVYHLDECFSICRAHAKCGSCTFEPRSCTLYGAWSYSNDNTAQQISSSNYYIDNSMFNSQEPHFSKGPFGFCVASSDTSGTEVSAVGSSYECAKHCLGDETCEMFTFDEDKQKSCIIYDSSTGLSNQCKESSIETYLLYDTEFVEMEDACLDVEEKKEMSTNSTLKDVSLIECAAVCDHWTKCNSFRYDDETGSCALMQSVTYIDKCDKNTIVLGNLYLPKWAVSHEMVLGSERKCAKSATDGVFVEGIARDACIRQCNLIDCTFMEFTPSGDCIMLINSQNCTQAGSGNNGSIFMTPGSNKVSSVTGGRRKLLSHRLSATNRQLFLDNHCSSCQTLMSKSQQLTNKVTQFLPKISSAQQSIGNMNSLIGAITNPVEKLAKNLGNAANTLNAFDKVGILLERIPYIGYIVKALRLRSLSRGASSKCKKGKDFFKKVDKKFDVLSRPTETIERQFVSFSDGVQYFIGEFEDFATFLVDLLHLVYESSLQPLFSKLKGVVDALSAMASSFLSFVDRLFSALLIFDKIGSLINGNVLNVLKFISNGMDTLFNIFNSLSFLHTIMTFTIYIPYPHISWGWKCWWWFCIPWPSFRWKHFGISIERVGKWLQDIVNAIKSIPIIGWLVSILEDGANKIFEALFPEIRLPIPNLGLSLDFVDDVKNDIEDTVQRVAKEVDKFKDFVDVGGLFGIMSDSIQSIKSKFGISFDISELKLSCDDVSCIMDKLSNILGIGLDDLKLYPEEVVETLGQVADNIDEISDLVARGLINDMIECESSTRREVNIIGEIKNRVGLQNVDIPEYPIGINICNNIQLTGMDTFISEINDLFQQIGVIRQGWQQQRSLSNNERELLAAKPGFQISLPKSKKLIDKVAKTMFHISDGPTEFKPRVFKGLLLQPILDYNPRDVADIYLLFGFEVVNSSIRLEKISLKFGQFLKLGLDVRLKDWQQRTDAFDKALETINTARVNDDYKNKKGVTQKTKDKKKALMLQNQMKMVDDETYLAGKKFGFDCRHEYIITTKKIYDWAKKSGIDEKFGSNLPENPDGAYDFEYHLKLKNMTTARNDWQDNRKNYDKHRKTNKNYDASKISRTVRSVEKGSRNFKQVDEDFRKILLKEFRMATSKIKLENTPLIDFETGPCSGIDNGPNRQDAKAIWDALRNNNDGTTTDLDVTNANSNDDLQTVLTEIMKKMKTTPGQKPTDSVFNNLKSLVHMNYHDYQDMLGSELAIKYKRKYVFGGFTQIENEFDLLHSTLPKYGKQNTFPLPPAEHSSFFFSIFAHLQNKKAIETYNQKKKETEIKDKIDKKVKDADIPKNMISGGSKDLLYMFEDRIEISVDLLEIVWDVWKKGESVMRAGELIGCFIDRPTRDLNHFAGQDFSIDECINECKTKGYSYAGLQYHGQCYCDNKYGSHGVSSVSECNTHCNKGGGICGGAYRNSVYKTANYWPGEVNVMDPITG